MLHIILLILKIIGFLVLVVLGLLFLALALVLIVPIRYRAAGSYEEVFRGTAKITWLLHILSIKARFGEETSVTVRLFGLRLFKEKKSDEAVKEDASQAVERAAGELTENAAESARAADTGIRLDQDARAADTGIKLDQDVRAADTGIKLDQDSRATDEELEQDQDIRDGGCGFGPRSGRPSIPAAQAGASKAAGMERTSKENGGTEDAVEADEPAPPEKKSFISRIREFFRSLVQKLKFSFHRICGTLKNINGAKEQVSAWIHDEENQRMVRLLYRQTKKALRHLLPRRFKGEITFGFDDPYITGQVLGYMALTYPWLKDRVAVNPVFDRQILEGEISLKGRIRLGTLLVCAIRVLLNKNFRTVLKKALG